MNSFTHSLYRPIYDSAKPNRNIAVFVDANSEDELRARRVWLFVRIMWLTWLFFAVYLNIRGYGAGAWICVIDLAFLTIANGLMWRNTRYAVIMNLNLVASAIGLFLVSVSHTALNGNMLFYPVAILVASQLLGVRVAFAWFVVNVIALVLFFLVVHGAPQTLNSELCDELIQLLAVVACVYFCCQQGEVFYQIRTKTLLKLSKDLEAKSATLEVLATTDALTGLMNRFQFKNRLLESVAKAKADSTLMALFMIDMNGFKQINDTLGHPTGDAALRIIAERLQLEFGNKHDVARLGGDEFCIIAAGLNCTEQADAIAKRACEVLNGNYTFAETEFMLSASVGYCLCPQQCTSDNEALAFADTAMFHAKENRLGSTCYLHAMTDRLVEYRTTQQKLAVALERDEFHLLYQPQVDLTTGRILGVEALIRWENEGRVISPFNFIPLLESSGEILAVGDWVIHEACRQLSVWNQQGHDIAISVNVSAVQFKDPKLFTNVSNSVVKFNLDPRRLDFEITEGHLVDDVTQAIEKLNMLKEMGASISIDDFGTGYSSLAYLRQFPIDRLKIDRAFVKDIPNQDDGLIASSIIQLAKTLGLRVLAEGVETETQLQHLIDQDCDEYQGFYFSKPVCADEISRLLNQATQSGSTIEKSQQCVILGYGG